MGRHTAPEPHPSVSAPPAAGLPGPQPPWGEQSSQGWQWPQRAPQREADPARWWRQASARRRSFAVAAVAVPVLALVVAGNAGGTSHTASTSPAESARMQGVRYAEELRDEGQTTLSINVNCMANTGGYSGTSFEDYQQGCVAVTSDMIASGRG